MNIPALPFKVKTTVSWAGEEDGDLGFIENEIVEVLSIVDESWWNGRLRRNGAEGIFPKDYVEVIEEQIRTSSSSRSVSNSRQSYSRQTTPQKEEPEMRFKYSRNSYHNEPSGYHSKKQSYNPREYGSREASFTEDDYSNSNIKANTSLDTIDFSKGSRSKNDYFRKHKSSTQLNLSSNNPKQLSDSQDRDREIEAFKKLQKQNTYHIKKDEPYKRYLLQHVDSSRGSGENYGNYTVSKPSIPVTHKHPYSKQDIQSYRYSFGDPRVTHLTSKQQFRESDQQERQLMPHEQPIKSQKERDNYYAIKDDYVDNLDISFEEISKKRQQLEMELQYLRELEKTSQKRRMQNMKMQANNGSKEMINPASIESSYISEDLTSSKKNYRSGDELGAKLNRYVTDEIDEEELHEDFESGSPPPPPPPKHITPVKQFSSSTDQSTPTKTKSSPVTKVPYNADDFKISGQSFNKPIYEMEEDFLKVSQIKPQNGLNSSIKSLQSDVLNLSELSATSAGSFLRHKYEKELRMSNLAISEGPTLDEELRFGRRDSDQLFMGSSFQEKKSRNPNIFQKFLQKKRPEDINGLEQKIQEDMEVDWTTIKMELNRMNSLTSQDKQARTKRVLKEAGPFIVKPLDYISDINSNDVLGENDEISLEFNPTLFKKVDMFIDNYDLSYDLNDLISDISIKFNSSKVCQLRCILIYICKFQIIEENEKILRNKPKVNEILLSGKATIFQLNYLFKKMLDALRIPSEVVLGFWKKPNEFYHSDQYVTNHAWLSVLLDNQFLLLDMHCFKNGSVCNIRDNPRGYNEFYFLTKPLNLISTHIALVTDLQHVVPPIDQNVCFHLPRAYSGFYKSNLKFNNFNNALTILKDLEFFELEVEIPTDIELFTLVKTSNVTTNELSLCQVQWINNKRIAKIKAILPDKENIGVLQIFAGPKGLQKHFDNIHELAIVIPIQHSGDYRACKFVPRFPTYQSQNNDLYIKLPQNSTIFSKNTYNFIILQHPSRGVNSGSGLMNGDFKIVIESPSGKYFKLIKDDDSLPYGSLEANIKCQEVGIYRGLVIGDSGNSWYVFAQWECIPNGIS